MALEEVVLAAEETLVNVHSLHHPPKSHCLKDIAENKLG